LLLDFVDIHKELQSSTEYPKTEFRIQTEIECVSTKSSKYVPNFQVCHLKIIESMDFCIDRYSTINVYFHVFIEHNVHVNPMPLSLAMFSSIRFYLN